MDGHSLIRKIRNSEELDLYATDIVNAILDFYMHDNSVGMKQIVDAFKDNDVSYMFLQKPFLLISSVQGNIDYLNNFTNDLGTVMDLDLFAAMTDFYNECRDWQRFYDSVIQSMDDPLQRVGPVRLFYRESIGYFPSRWFSLDFTFPFMDDQKTGGIIRCISSYN